VPVGQGIALKRVLCLGGGNPAECWPRRMFMCSNPVIAGNPQTEHKSLRRDEHASENELENRIKNLDKLVNSVHTALHQVSFSGKLRALDLISDLRVKIEATHNMLRVAKLLSEPARESMLSRVRYSLNELEEVIASHMDVEMA
jgi:hypothetical protein